MKINTGDRKCANFVRCEKFVFKREHEDLEKTKQHVLVRSKSSWSLKESKDETVILRHLVSSAKR